MRQGILEIASMLDDMSATQSSWLARGAYRAVAAMTRDAGVLPDRPEVVACVSDVAIAQAFDRASDDVDGFITSCVSDDGRVHMTSAQQKAIPPSRRVALVEGSRECVVCGGRAYQLVNVPDSQVTHVADAISSDIERASSGEDDLFLDEREDGRCPACGSDDCTQVWEDEDGCAIFHCNACGNEFYGKASQSMSDLTAEDHELPMGMTATIWSDDGEEWHVKVCKGDDVSLSEDFDSLDAAREWVESVGETMGSTASGAVIRDKDDGAATDYDPSDWRSASRLAARVASGRALVDNSNVLIGGHDDGESFASDSGMVVASVIGHDGGDLMWRVSDFDGSLFGVPTVQERCGTEAEFGSFVDSNGLSRVMP